MKVSSLQRVDADVRSTSTRLSNCESWRCRGDETEMVGWSAGAGTEMCSWPVRLKRLRPLTVEFDLSGTHLGDLLIALPAIGAAANP